jgi:hypothetical protein
MAKSKKTLPGTAHENTTIGKMGLTRTPQGYTCGDWMFWRKQAVREMERTKGKNFGSRANSIP